jgi:hypothetical protein
MFPALIYGGILLGEYIYHRYGEPPKRPAGRDERIDIPKTDEGSSVPILFGRTLVRKPVIAWSGNADRIDDVAHAGLSYYRIDIHWLVATPMAGGTNRYWSAYASEKKMGLLFPPIVPGPGTSDQDNSVTVGTTLSPDYLALPFEFWDGSPTQDLSTGSLLSLCMTAAGIAATEVPGYRGVMTVTTGQTSKLVRREPSLPDIAFELSSYPPYPSLFDAGASYFITSQHTGDEGANPADVIASIICDAYAKLGRDPSTILDSTSFRLAALALFAEGHGFSRAFEDRLDTGEMIDEILRQIDAVLYQEPTTGRFVLKLIRGDYDPNSLQTIDPSNCEAIDNFAAAGWANTVNKVRLVFTNRADGYQDGSATAQNMANAAGQDGEVRELEIRMPGVSTQAIADILAARELAANSRPLRRCRAKVSRVFWNRRPGDVVNLNWPELNISKAVMRVAAVSRGNASENCVYLDLIEDFFYVHRNVVYPGGNVIGSLPGVNAIG